MIIVNNQKNVYVYLELQELIICNEVKHNKFDNILSIQTDFKGNNINQNISNNNRIKLILLFLLI